MSLSKFVKIGHISSLSDARYCAGMMVDILGFEIGDEKSEHYVDADTFSELTGWVAGVSFAGEFGDQPLEYILSALEKYQIQYIESNVLYTLNQLANTEKELIYKLVVTNDNIEQMPELIKQAQHVCSLIIVDKTEDVSSESIEATLPKLTTAVKLLKGFDNDTNTATHLHDSWDGIELKATTEEQTGFKDYGEIMDILEVIEDQD